MKTFRIACAALGALVLAGCSGPMTRAGLTPQPKVKALDATESQVARLLAKLEKRPSDPKSMNELAAAYLQRGRETGELSNYLLARETAEDLLAKHPNDVDALVTTAWVMTIFHDFDKAQDLAGRALATDPGNSAALGIVADSHFELGAYEDALAAAQKMVDRKPNLASYSRAAQLRWIEGDAKGATFFYIKAIEAGGSQEAVNWARVQLGDVQLKTGAYPAAERMFTSVLERMPDYRHAKAGLARVRAAQGKTDVALTLMREAASVDPSVTTLDELGDLLALSGRASEAREAYDRSSKAMDAHLKLGIGGDEPMVARLWLSRGERHKEALELMMTEVEHHKSVAVYATLAWAQAANGKNADAVTSVDRALRTGTKEPWILRRCAEVLAACRLTERAEALEAEARAVCPSDALWALL